MRLFFAFNLERKDKNQLKSALAKIKKFFPFERWIPEENWHLTLAFLGNIYNKETINYLKSLLLTIPKSRSKINTIVYKIDFAPPQTVIKRMIWAYIKNTEELNNLYREIKISLNKIGIQQTSQNNFLPHINLVRLKKTYRDKTLNHRTNFNLTLRKLNLYQSILSPKNAKYMVLKSTKLN